MIIANISFHLWSFNRRTLRGIYVYRFVYYIYIFPRIHWIRSTNQFLMQFVKCVWKSWDTNIWFDFQVIRIYINLICSIYVLHTFIPIIVINCDYQFSLVCIRYPDRITCFAAIMMKFIWTSRWIVHCSVLWIRQHVFRIVFRSDKFRNFGGRVTDVTGY